MMRAVVRDSYQRIVGCRLQFIPKGARLAIVSHFDNSPNNPLNPDPTKVVRWGEASEMEMMDGWIEYLDASPSAAKLPARAAI